MCRENHKTTIKEKRKKIMSKKPTVLMILDGFGLNDKTEGNAVAQANTPVIDKLMKDYPFVKGYASGLAVGLPEGQMGNSEVGHMNMGAGRIVYQELTRITKEIEDGDFFENRSTVSSSGELQRKMIPRFICSDCYPTVVYTATIHICMDCLEMAKENGVEKVYVHCFLDGRDTPPTSGKGLCRRTSGKDERDRCWRDRFRYGTLLCDGS